MASEDTGSVSVDTNRRQSGLGSPMTQEAEQELRHFLKLVRPDWLNPRKVGRNDVNRVIEKLKLIGVSDTQEFIRRVTTNKINEDFLANGMPRFSRDTIDVIRKQSRFMEARDHMTEANYRQMGVFAHVPQMLATKNLRHQVQSSGSLLRTATQRHEVRRARGSRSSSETGSRSRHQGGGNQESSGTMRSAHSSGDLAATLQDALDGEDAPNYDSGGAAPSQRRAAASRRPPKGRLEPPTGRLPPRSVSLPQLVSANEGMRTPPSARTDASPSLGASPRDSKAMNFSATAPPGLSRKAPSDAMGPSSSLRRESTAKSGMARGSDESLDEQATSLYMAGWGNSRPGRGRHAPEPRNPSWTTLDMGTALQHGEAMLREQAALDERKILERTMNMEGHQSPMRCHIAKNIEERMKEERLRASNSQSTMDVQQRVINIRKNLSQMVNTKRELQAMLRQVRGMVEEDDEKPVQLTLELFNRSKAAAAAWSQGNPTAGSGTSSRVPSRGGDAVDKTGSIKELSANLPAASFKWG